MVDLNFHCCMCGEENDIKTYVDLQELEQDVYLDCQYCNAKIIATVQSKHIVTWLEEQ